jgi:hypothetical protein
MPYTEKVIKSDNIKKGKSSGPYRPEEDYAAGISWGTLTMFKGAEDPQAKKH